jgi:hypothetical protein
VNFNNKGKYMKKSLIVFIIGFLTSTSTLAATTGSIVVTGQIAQNVSITITSAPASTFDLGVAQTNLVIGTVNEFSNDPNGYKLTLASNNAGVLKNGTLGSATYTAQYNGVSVTLSVTPQSVTSVASQTTVVNSNKNLTISVPAQTNVMQGNYTDTLVFAVTAN